MITFAERRYCRGRLVTTIRMCKRHPGAQWRPVVQESLRFYLAALGGLGAVW